MLIQSPSHDVSFSIKQSIEYFFASSLTICSSLRPFFALIFCPCTINRIVFNPVFNRELLLGDFANEEDFSRSDFDGRKIGWLSHVVEEVVDVIRICFQREACYACAQRTKTCTNECRCFLSGVILFLRLDLQSGSNDLNITTTTTTRIMMMMMMMIPTRPLFYF